MKASKDRWMDNNIYAVKMLWNISRRRTIHVCIMELVSYFEWIFFQIFFLRYIIGCLEKEERIEHLFLGIGICGVVFAIVALYNCYTKSFVIPLTDVIISKEIYLRLYKKACNVELECYENSDFYNKYMMALDNAGSRIINAVDDFFKMIFGFVGTVVVFGYIIQMDWKAGIFVVFPLLGNFIFGKKINNISYERYVEDISNRRQANYLDRLMRLPDYAKDMRYTDIYQVLLSNYKKSIDNTETVMQKYGKKCAKNVAIKNILTFPVVFEGIMIYASFKTIVLGNMGVADLAVIFSTMSTASWILLRLFNTITDLIKNGVTISYIRSFLDYKEKIPENQDGIVPSGPIETIEFRDVTFGYKEGSPIIEHLCVKICSGQSVALIGDNGAGKTTFIKLLLRLYDPIDGEIFMNGINIKEYNLKAYRSWFSVVFQDFKLFAMSIKDNILMGDLGGEEDVAETLKEAGIYNRINCIKDGIGAEVSKEFNEEGVIFSGGETQKVAIARALAKKSAKIFIFDEPTKALDPIAECDLYSGIMRKSDKKIMIIITHRLSSVKNANVVALFKDGKLVECGTHRQLLQKSGYYAEMYSKQAEAYLASTY